MSAPWDRAAASFRGDLADSLCTDSVRALHILSPARHALMALRPALLLAIGALAIVLGPPHLAVRIPAAIAIGLALFTATILLHEAIHGLITGKRTAWPERILAHVYAIPSGLSSSQFARWHLDHHDHLGTTDADPKRAHLSPKRNVRWLKLLYLTPALFPIYFRAAYQAARSYEPALRASIRRERLAATAFHVSVLVALVMTLGWEHAAWLHILPVFVVFPLAFTVNRLGQHYDVDPNDPAHWGTLMTESPWFWNVLFLNSNYHLEHHYFPRVPFYNLPALRRALEPFFAARGIRPRTYIGLLWDWFVRNRPPHANWSERPAPSVRSAPAKV